MIEKKTAKSISIYLDTEKIRRLDRLAVDFGQSRSLLIESMIEDRLAYYEEYIAYMNGEYNAYINAKEDENEN